MAFECRAPSTTPDIWYPANAVAGKWLFGSGAVTLTFSAGLYLLAPGAGGVVYALACAIVVLLALSVSVVRSMMYLRTL
jgi:hypothetical protein